MSKFFSVTQLNKYIKGLLETDVILSGVWIKGEISNFKRNLSGHAFFSLKDKSSTISCVLFKTAGEIMGVELKNGLEVFLYGYVSLYEKTGTYQFYVEKAEISGAGVLEAQFRALKEKLLKEGLFDEDFKREIPSYAENIAVITSPYGAAVRDIIKTIRRKNKNINIKIIPVTVQGDLAPPEIAEALDFVNKEVSADIIIVARGGGSLEDLQAFNEEEVARAIFRSEIPVISGVGHQTDFTISDFTADLRAATPTAAAEIASWSYNETLFEIEELKSKIENLFKRNFEEKRIRLENAVKSSVMRNPEKLIELSKYDFKYYLERFEKCGIDIIEKNTSKLEILNTRLDGLSPFLAMKRGFSVVYGKGGKIINSVKSLKNGDAVDIYFGDGIAEAEVFNLKESLNGEEKN